MRYFTVATAGHVDHGKTSLLRALTGIDPDRLKEEKERQMTTDLGFAHLALDDMVVGFVDVPGHGKFLKNMLAGVGGIDIAMLVVAADEGPMPQTVQHVRILSFLGVPNILVALNKVDMCDKDQIETSRQKTEALLKEYGLNLVGTIAVSAIKQTGITELKTSIVAVCSAYQKQANGKTLFFPVDRVFTKSGFGTVVTGTLVEGELRVGSEVFIGNKNARVKVRRLESFGATVDKALPGQRVAVNLAGKENLERGDVLTSEKLTVSDVLVVSLSNHGEQVGHDLAGQDIRVYHGTKEEIGRVRFVIGNMAKVALAGPLVARVKDKLIFRLADDTILGGSILVLDPPRWLTKEKLLALNDVLIGGDYQKVLPQYLQLSPQGILPLTEIKKVLPPDGQAFPQLVKDGVLVEASDAVMTKSKQEALFKAIFEALPGTQEFVRGKVMPAQKRQIFQAIIQQLLALGKIELKKDLVAVAGHMDVEAPAISSELLLELRKILTQNICLEIDELAHRLNSDSKEVRRILSDLSREKQAAIVAYDFASLQENIDKSHSIAAQLWQKKKDIAPGEFREALGVSRKYAMALLSYFDDQQITRRLPSGRVLLKAPIR